MTSLTKDAIKQSFLKLLNKKPIDKITVKEIVEDCGIIKQLFFMFSIRLTVSFMTVTSTASRAER